MRTGDIIQTAWSNLQRNKTRSMLTIIAVFVGAITITLTNGIGDGIKSYLYRQIGSLGAGNVLVIIQQAGSRMSQKSDAPQKYDPTKVKLQSNSFMGPGGGGIPYMLTQHDLDEIANDPDVTVINPALNLTTDYVTTGANKYLIDAQPTFSNALHPDLAAGRELNKDTGRYEVLLPTAYLSPLGFPNAQAAVDKEITLAVSDQNKNQKEFSATIAGVANKSFVTANTLILNRAFSTAAVAYQETGKPEAQKHLYSAAVAEFKDGLSEDRVKDLKTRLAKKGYWAATIKDQQQTVFSVIDAIVLVLNLFGIVALIAASFGIINTLYMAVQERTKEIGLMKAVGMGKGKIFSLFSIEAALLGLIGSAAGVGVANVVGRVINRAASAGILKDFEGLQLLTFKPVPMAAIITLVTLIAFLAGTLPARKASKLDPIEALRYE